MDRQKRNNRRSDICNIDVNRAPLAKHLEKNFPNFFIKRIESDITKQKTQYPKALKEIAREEVRIDDKQLIKEIA